MLCPGIKELHKRNNRAAVVPSCKPWLVQARFGGQCGGMRCLSPARLGPRGFAFSRHHRNSPCGPSCLPLEPIRCLPLGHVLRARDEGEQSPAGITGASQISNPDPLPFLLRPLSQAGNQSSACSLGADQLLTKSQKKKKPHPKANALFAQTAVFSEEGEWESSSRRLPTSRGSAASPGADSAGELRFQVFVLTVDQRENFPNDFSI